VKLEEVVVTGQKREERLIDVPSAWWHSPRMSQRRNINTE